MATAQSRRAAGAAAVAAGKQTRARGAPVSGDGAPAARLARAVPAHLAVSADGGAAPCRRGNRAGSGTHRAHAPPAAGRRRLGQDRGRRARRRHRDRRRLAMRADGAHRNPGGAAFSQADRLARAAVDAARAAGRMAYRRPEEEGAGRDAGAGGQRRSGPGGRHPCGDPGAGPVPAPGPGHHRRAAPVRRRAETGFAGQSQLCAGRSGCARPHPNPPPHGGGRSAAGASHAHDERDADPAHLGDELLRRPRRVHHRRTAPGPHARW